MLSLCKLYSNKKGGEGYEVAWNQTKITLYSNYFAYFVSDKNKNQNSSKALQVTSASKKSGQTTVVREF